MTVEQADSLSVFLRAMGFRDTGSEHNWNILSFQKSFGPLNLLVWGREHQGPFVQIAYPDPYDGCVTVHSGIDEVEEACRKTQAFLESISLKEVAA